MEPPAARPFTLDPQKCLFMIKNKHRQCSRQRQPNSDYCGNHAHLAESPTPGTADPSENSIAEDVGLGSAAAAKTEKDARIPCPVDPAHTVRRSQLEKHVKRCESAKKQERAVAAAAARASLPPPPYYSRGVNAGPPPPNALLDCDAVALHPADEERALTDPEKLALLRRIVETGAFGHGSLARLGDAAALLSDSVSAGAAAAAVAQLGAYNSDRDISVLAATAGTPDGVTEGEGQEDGGGGSEITGTAAERRHKHRVQEDAITEHLAATVGRGEDGAAATLPPWVVVELGAGTGGLSKAVRKLAPAAPIVLVDNQDFKPRHDRFWRENVGAGWARVTVDLRDVVLAELPHVNPTPMPVQPTPAQEDAEDVGCAMADKLKKREAVLVAKHLCGVATDYTINACGHLHDTSGTQPGRLAIATCCHHVCSWSDYPSAAKAWLWDVARIGRPEFELMRSCMGWAIDGGPSGSTTDAKRQAKDRERLAELRERAAKGDQGAKAEVAKTEARIRAAVEAKAWRKEMDPATRRAAGRACKILLDTGRREAIRSLGLRCELLQYCSEAFTLENRLLLAWKPQT